MTKNLNDYIYRCRVCNAICTKKRFPQDSHGPVDTGHYGNAAVPPPTSLASECYEATTISFTSGTPASISDSAKLFAKKGLREGAPIRVSTTSGTNDGDYTIRDRGVSMGEILLSDSDSLTTENAATAGTVTISRLIYEPNVTRGCPLCGSLNSK